MNAHRQEKNLQRIKNNLRGRVGSDELRLGAAALCQAFRDLVSTGDELEAADGAVDLEALDKVIDAAVAEFEKDTKAALKVKGIPPSHTRLDHKLIEDIHKGLPISRRTAGDIRVWDYLAGYRYTELTALRWQPYKGKRSEERLLGNQVRNSMARLWWAAELTVDRDSDTPDYSLTHQLLALKCFQDAYEALFGRSFTRYRPALAAFITEVPDNQDVFRETAKVFGQVCTTIVMESRTTEQLQALVARLVEEVQAGGGQGSGSVDSGEGGEPVDGPEDDEVTDETRATQGKRSDEEILVGFFLARCSPFGGAPPQLGGLSVWEGFRVFHEALGDGREETQFGNSLNNTRDTFDRHLPNERKGWDKDLDAREQAVFDEWAGRPEEELWEAVQPFLPKPVGDVDTGKGGPIQMESFCGFVRALAAKGLPIPTIGGQATFEVEVNQDGFVFIPTSTGRGRGHNWKYIQRVLDTFNETGSLESQAYQFTVMRSYQLALIRDYLAEGE